MNDGTQVDCSRDGSGTVPARASFERLLRKLQALPNRPAVIVLNSYSFIRGAMGSYLKVCCLKDACLAVELVHRLTAFQVWVFASADVLP